MFETQDSEFACAGLHFTALSAFEERKASDQLACRLAIAKRDLRMATSRGDLNAVERAIRDVNEFRARSGLPGVAGLPEHEPDPSLHECIGRMENGTRLYRRGFGLEVGQRVKWMPGLGKADRTGIAEAIFEYGRNPIVLFAPDEGAAFWTAPTRLQAMEDSPVDLQGALLLMPCSGRKLASPAPAGEIYTGVMWQSLRANGLGSRQMLILSALHGLIDPQDVIAPYERQMDAQRALELQRSARQQAEFVMNRIGRSPLKRVFVAGGKLYRQVFIAIIDELRREGVIRKETSVACTSGGIGYQRSQLGEFLRGQD